MKKARGYVATASWKSHEAYPFTAEMLDLIRRRTEPFLDNIGLQTTPLAHIVQEVYLQGLKDAIDALNHRDAPPQNDKGPAGLGRAWKTDPGSVSFDRGRPGVYALTSPQVSRPALAHRS